MKNVGVILSGGKGERLGDALPKQFIKFAGKTCIEHCCETFFKNENIDTLVVVSNPDYIHETQCILEKMSCSKSWFVIPGGNTRNESTYNAINFVDPSTKNLIIHDAVRPLLTQRIINDCISALSCHDAIDVVIPATDTIIEKDADSIKNIPLRSNLMLGQTPQAFNYAKIKLAYEKIGIEHMNNFSDDCGVFIKAFPEDKVFLVKGEQYNVKLTRKEDVPLIDRLFQLKHASSTDFQLSFDSIKEKVFVIFGGTSGIGLELVNLLNINGIACYVASRKFDVDITHKSDIDSFLKKVYQKEGHIDYVINTVGELIKAPLITLDDEIIAQTVQTNYIGALSLAKIAYSYLKESHGMLVLFGSSSYTRGRKNYVLYSSLKAGIVNICQALADEWAEDGICVNCISPARTLTPMRTKSFGNEDPSTLLSAKFVAQKTLSVCIQKITGETVDISLIDQKTENSK